MCVLQDSPKKRDGCLFYLSSMQSADCTQNMGNMGQSSKIWDNMGHIFEIWEIWEIWDKWEPC